MNKLVLIFWHNLFIKYKYSWSICKFMLFSFKTIRKSQTRKCCKFSELSCERKWVEFSEFRGLYWAWCVCHKSWQKQSLLYLAHIKNMESFLPTFFDWGKIEWAMALSSFLSCGRKGNGNVILLAAIYLQHCAQIEKTT